MEQQPSPPAIAPKAECVIVNLELQVVVAGNAAATNGSDNYHVVDVKACPKAGGQHVVVDVDRLAVNIVPETSPKGHAAVELKPRGDDTEQDGAAGNKQNRCVVCTKPMEWVAIGRCGHGVCSKCMVTNRFFQQNKRCCICKTHCPKVLVVAKANGVGEGAAYKLSKLPRRFVFRDGRVGEYWYHGYTSAYFEEEKEYEIARAECEGILVPFYQPLGPLIVCFCLDFFCGGYLGYVIAGVTNKHLSSKVLAYVLSMLVNMLLFFIVLWSAAQCRKDPSLMEESRQARDVARREGRL